MSRAQHVTSVDGTRIGYVTSGTGPPLVMVHGATADHTAMSRLAPLLEADCTVHVIDRRGRGLSGDTSPYDISLEYADVATVVDRVASESGAAVSVYGHSYGAVCALGAAALTRNLQRLVLYEPGFEGVVLTPDDVLGQLDALVAEGAVQSLCEAGGGSLALARFDTYRCQDARTDGMGVYWAERAACERAARRSFLEAIDESRRRGTWLCVPALA